MKRPLITLAAAAACLGHLFSAEPFDTRADLLEHIEHKRQFEFDIDQDANTFPDAWFREDGRAFQNYHPIIIDEKEGYQSPTSLRLSFSGGKTGVRTAPLKLPTRFAYNLRLAYRSEGLTLQRDQKVTLGLRAYDKDDNLLRTFSTTIDDFQSQWQVDPSFLRIETLPEGTSSCTVFVHLEGRPSGWANLWIDALNIETSPRISLNTKRPLNTFGHDASPSFEQSVDGTQAGASYRLVSQVTNFLGQPMRDFQENFMGTDRAHTMQRELKDFPPGVYTVNSTLYENGKQLVTSQYLIARDSVPEIGLGSGDIGVILGRPSEPFTHLLQSLSLLGTDLSKLELLPGGFDLEGYHGEVTSNDNIGPGFPELDPLLRTHAPDLGLKFTGVLQGVPASDDPPHLQPKHIAETFNRSEWPVVLSDLLLHYGNVLKEWQFGHDKSILNDKHWTNSANLVEHLRGKSDWMKIVLPGAERFGEEHLVNGFYVPSSQSLSDLETLLGEEKEPLSFTVELNTGDPLMVVEKLVKRIALIKAARTPDGRPMCHSLFIDQLSGEEMGLTDPDFNPRPSYFAAKTVIRMMKGAAYMGEIQHSDHDVRLLSFSRGPGCFAITWRPGASEPTPLYLGADLKVMDLMGNTTTPPSSPGGSTMVNIGPTPTFIIGKDHRLWQTMLSFKLARNDIEAKVQLQDQTLKFTNRFDDAGKFDITVGYPSDWQLTQRRFEPKVLAGDTFDQPLRLSPSPLFPINLGVPVHIDTDISLADGSRHRVRVYREDKVSTDVSTQVSFFREGEGLKMEIQLAYADAAPRMSSFIASAQLPDGRVLETFFKRVQPGEQRMASLFISGANPLMGRDLTLSVRENIGQRYINNSFPIQTAFE